MTREQAIDEAVRRIWPTQRMRNMLLGNLPLHIEAKRSPGQWRDEGNHPYWLNAPGKIAKCQREFRRIMAAE